MAVRFGTFRIKPSTYGTLRQHMKLNNFYVVEKISMTDMK